MEGALKVGLDKESGNEGRSGFNILIQCLTQKLT